MPGMSSHSELDFLTSVGEAFCEELAPALGVDDACAHDFQEVLWRAVGRPLTPELLADSRESTALSKIADECAAYFEVGTPLVSMRCPQVS